jgi:hypothetical protein
MRLLAAAIAIVTIATAQTNPPALPTVANKTVSMKAMPGYFPIYWDPAAGKIWLEIDKWNTEFLYVPSLPAGIGSNDIGLDRGQLGEEKILRFERSGNKVLLVQPNYRFRAITENPDERRSVEEAFAQSVLWGFTVEAEQGGRVLVDATPFYIRDAHDVIGALRTAKQGTFKLDPSRSAVYLPHTKNFPTNTEVEATLTFTGDEPGKFVREVTPTPDSITVREHQSFVELPGPGYTPRAFDPRAGYYGISFYDFATRLGQPVIKQYIVRHRLTADRPLIYYLDRGAPEPIRSALLDGARWWNQAFEAAGFKDAFRVELMPEDADPMDIRYNVIQWVHRATRGWSYGASVTDPRTGEIIKGHVTLGSLRARQDYLIAEGLLAPYEDGKPAPPELERLVLARLRQLAAHEVGHTLGLSHNYAASIANRSSVMDYPHPLVELSGSGALDVSKAYAAGIGDWDKVAIRWGYGDEAREKILSDASQRGLYYITDADSRPQGSAHPFAHLWDNGVSPVDELNRMMRVRARVLERFGERNIPEGAPMATLEEALVPMYLLHRYQTEAAAKTLGGVNYRYALRGDGQLVTEAITGAEQLRALQALLTTINPTALTLPERILRLLPPRPPGYPRTRESFPVHTGLTFDPMAAAESAANLTVGLILNADRAARLIENHARDESQPDFSQVVNSLIAATWTSPRRRGLEAETQRVIEDVVVYHLMVLAADDTVAQQVRAVALERLINLRNLLVPAKDANTAAHFRYLKLQVDRFEHDPKQVTVPRPVEPPPGQPIGEDAPW